MKGYVYILTNPSMPGMVKIGRTSRSVSGRAGELYQTGVPTPFAVEHYLSSPDCVDLEKKVHKLLDEHRVGAGREFFRVDVQHVKQCLADCLREQIDEIVDEYLPGHMPAERDLLVDPADISLVCQSAGVDVPEFILAFDHIAPSEVAACVERRNAERVKAANINLQPFCGGLLN